MNTKLRLLISRNIRSKETQKEAIIENVSVININGKLLFPQQGEIDICVFAKTDNVDIKYFSEKYGTMEVIITSI